MKLVGNVCLVLFQSTWKDEATNYPELYLSPCDNYNFNIDYAMLRQILCKTRLIVSKCNS